MPRCLRLIHRFAPSTGRIGLGFLLALALVAGLIPGLSGIITPSAQALPSAVTPVITAVQPATDKAGVVELWKKGGPTTKLAAKAALLTDDAGLQDFISTGQYVALQQDYRTTAVQLSLVGRYATRTAAEAAINDGSWQALQKFVTTGWQAAWLQDDRAATFDATQDSSPMVKKGAETALASGDIAVQNFIATGKANIEKNDNIAAVYGLAETTPNVSAAATAALKSSNPEAIDDFLRYGQFVAAARDAETATVTQLANQAKSASSYAIASTKKAQLASDQAVKAAQLAKKSAQQAAAEAKAAAGSAKIAGAAASRAASLANQAAKAAQLAVSAAQEARQALSQAAAAAANAAAAAARTEEAAAAAQNAAADAATNASKAQAARIAATNARTAAAGAQKAVDAANQAIVATNASKAASSAAAGAGQDSAAAAAAAAEAAQQSGVSASEAAAANAAAARANAAANRATQASATVDSLANQAAQQADIARTAAQQAIAHANAAAAAADDAANHAVDATTAATKSKQYAAAAKIAADAATASADKAALVQTQARKADQERLAAEREYLLANAREDKQLADAQKKIKDDAQAQATAAAATTKTLISQLTAPDADLNARVPEVKAAVFGVLEIGGPWQQAGAQQAIIGDPETLKAFVLNGYKIAKEQDQWDEVVQLSETGSWKFQVAADEALGGDQTTVEKFLSEDRWKVNHADDLAKAYEYFGSGGYAVKKAAEIAIRANTTDALRNFFQKELAAAILADERAAIFTIAETATPELKVAAEVALTGPDSYIHAFFTIGRLQATKRDQEASAYDASISALVSKAKFDAATARKNAALAAQVAALANKAAADAQRAAADAQKSANEAKASADQAVVFAQQASSSSDQAAQSATAAKAAANQAQADARTAGVKANEANISSAQAAAASGAASNAAQQAQASALAAGKDAATAAKAATETIDIATKMKQDEEFESKKAKVAGSPQGPPTQSELEESAGKTGGTSAIAELQEAQKTVANSDVLKFIIEQGGQILLDLFGITDIIDCATKGDILACVSAIVGFLPIGKIFKAGEALFAGTRIIPKIFEFLNKITDAKNTVAKLSKQIGTCAIGVVAGIAPLAVSKAGPQFSFASYPTVKTLAARTAAGGSNDCPKPNLSLGVKPGWPSTPALNGKGTKWQKPGSELVHRDADSIRIADPDSRYPYGYVKFHNSTGQPMNPAGKPGDRTDTHFPIKPDGSYDTPEGW